MNGEQRLLLIDHDPTSRQLCQEALNGRGSLAVAEDYETGLQTAMEQPADVILLGVVPEEAQVAQVCQHLQSSETTKDSPILFLTDHDSFSDKIFSYGLGAYDVILKPLKPQELKAKLAIIQQHKEQVRSLAQEAKLASETALSVMAGNNELGQAIRFVERSYSASNYENLAERFLSVMTGLDLTCVLMLSTSTEALYFSNGPNVSPLEKDLIITLYQQPGRFHDFGTRTVTKYSRVSLLVKNMPVDDSDRYGRLKDLFPSMMGAADARVKALDTELALLTQTNNTALSFQQIRSTLENLAEAYADNQRKTMTVMRDMLEELDFKIPGMGLDEDQEVYLIERIDNSIQEAADLLDQGENLNAAFMHISTLLEHLTQQLHQLKDEVISDSAEESGNHEDVVNEEPDDTDIELF